MVTWSLDPLLTLTFSQEVGQSAFNNSVMAYAYIALLLISFSYPIFHRIFLKHSNAYRKLGDDSSSTQLVVLHHFVEALLLGGLTPFFTNAMVVFNFQVHGLDVIKNKTSKIMCFSITILTMYFMEISSRYQKPRFIILFHHSITAIDGILVGLFPTSVMMKTAAILVYFICFESLLFVGLVMYRLFPDSLITPRVVFCGMVYFAATRPLQLLWVGATIFGSWNDTVKWQAIVQLIVTLILTTVQVFSLKIHYFIFKRCHAKQHGNTEKTLEGTVDSIQIAA